MDCDLNSHLFDGYIGGNQRQRYSNLTAEQEKQVADGAGQAIGLLGKLFKGKPKTADQQDIKNHCGRKPILKKKRKVWQKCVDDYTAQKNAAVAAASNTNNQTPAVDYAKQQSTTTNTDRTTNKPKGLSKPIIIGIVATSAVTLLVGGYFIYTKYFAG